jgi:hypothetical protein
MHVSNVCLETVKNLAGKTIGTRNQSEIKWQAVVKPKDLGGWGLKNIHLCGKTLAAKRV